MCRTTPSLRRLFVPLAQGYNGNDFSACAPRTRKIGRQSRDDADPAPALRDIDPDLPVLGMTPFTDLMEKSSALDC